MNREPEPRCGACGEPPSAHNEDGECPHPSPHRELSRYAQLGRYGHR